ncbi:MAG: hypothetical protein ACMXYK_00410 [Candidatus Woesearchaeota archaeon]
MKTKAQAGAAVVVGVMALLLVIYIVFIPISSSQTTPSRRQTGAAFLERDNEFIFEGPGLVESARGGREIMLPAINLRTRIESRIFLESNVFYVSNSFFEGPRTHETFFSVRNVDAVESMFISFIGKERTGVLRVTFNNVTVFENRMDSLNIPPIRIDPSLIREHNTISFSVSGVGLSFWRRHEYFIENFRVFGDVVELTQQSSLVNFELRQLEREGLERMRLRFTPHCSQTQVGRLHISVNNGLVYSQVPDCNILNIFDIPVSYVYSGINAIEFKTDRDSYLIDGISVESSVNDAQNLLYFFDIDRSLFRTTVESQAVCGEIDGVCPHGCSADNDKDCCFMEYQNAYWCSVPTQNENDRCVGRVDASNFDRCPSGYEDRRGRPPEGFEGLCGDNTDGVCPFGCSPFHDKDCCLEMDYYWCADMTTTGVSGMCVPVVTQESCAFCPSGYQSNTGRVSCEAEVSRNPIFEERTLKSDYMAELELRFVDDGRRKTGTVRINEFETAFDTAAPVFTRDISRFVMEGNNYVQILPQNQFNLVNIRVAVTER